MKTCNFKVKILEYLIKKNLMKIIGYLLAYNFKRNSRGRKRSFEINNDIACDMIENICKTVMDEYYFF